jgi:beta-phosphoglucomutase
MSDKIGLVFDMDGVITNTVPLHFKAWKKMFSEYGIELTFQMYRERVDGIPRMDGAAAILTDLSDEGLKRAADKKQQYFAQLLKTEDVEVYKDALEFINSLEEDKYKFAVASSSKNCKDILKKIGIINKFDAVVDGYGFKQGKPHPEIFLNAANLIKTEPACSIVFEDAKKGVEAAKNGRMLCVGVDRDNKPENLKRADIIIESFRKLDIKELEAMIEKNL